LEQNGFDAYLLKPKFVFNPPDPFAEITLEGLNQALQIGAITQADYVRNAKKLGKLDLDDPVLTGPFPAAPTQMSPNRGNIPSQPQPGTTMPMPLDPNAQANLASVQGELESLTKKLKEIMSGGTGAGSAVQGIQQKKPKRKKDAN